MLKLQACFVYLVLKSLCLNQSEYLVEKPVLMPYNVYGGWLCRPPTVGPLQWGLQELLPTSSCHVQDQSNQICSPLLEPLLIHPWDFWICCSYVLWLWPGLCSEHHPSHRWSIVLSGVSLEEDQMGYYDYELITQNRETIEGLKQCFWNKNSNPRMHRRRQLSINTRKILLKTDFGNKCLIHIIYLTALEFFLNS